MLPDLTSTTSCTCRPCSWEIAVRMPVKIDSPSSLAALTFAAWTTTRRSSLPLSTEKAMPAPGRRPGWVASTVCSMSCG